MRPAGAISILCSADSTYRHLVEPKLDFFHHEEREGPGPKGGNPSPLMTNREGVDVGIGMSICLPSP